eukprot:GFKZ01004796.1.p1 GENE.GFKZ01004796.1~~GFKZ01004796.1.p1  ORF type:complete len:363 (+),score=64.57 GFKZ01004796.1:41-1090(+)
MSPPPAFAPSTTFLPPALRHRAISPLKPPAPSFTTTAVLDTPASNTYLQRHAEVILRDFLTRRAVNTVMYYMEELRDSPSRDFLNNFDDFASKVKNNKFADGDAYLQKMTAAPTQHCSIRVGHARISRVYDFTIEPSRIAKRIRDSRIQLASEWARDLHCIAAENLEIQRLGFEKMFCKSEAELDSKRNLIFDSDPLASDQTPLRYKNYMALKTLTTQHAVARLLPYARDKGSNHEYMYLLQFVNSWGVMKNGDDFIMALMDRPLERRTNPDYIIHPRSVAAQILELRAVIAEEWIAVMEYFPEEQRLMTMDLLERSMRISDAPGEDVKKPGKRGEEGMHADKEGDECA